MASVPGLDISVSSKPVGGSSGGDLYLISSCSCGWITRLLLADIAGHGEAVSKLSNQLRKAMHKSISTVDQTKLARTLNTAFEDISGGAKFATALLMTYNAPSGHLVFVNAGHPPPLLCRAGSDQWIPIDQDADGALTEPTHELRVGNRNLPLGIIGSTQYEQIAIKLNPGDRVCAFTDGFTEAKSETNELLGTDGLASILSTFGSQMTDLTASDFAGAILREIQSQGYELADDDHTMLTIHLNGQSAPKPGLHTLSNMIKDTFGLGHSDSGVNT